MTRKFFKAISLIFLIIFGVEFYSFNLISLSNFLLSQIKKLKIIKILNNNYKIIIIDWISLNSADILISF
jgi:hypothetical protein